MLKRFAQSGLILIVLFEILCWIGIFPFTLDFSWFGLIGTATGVFIILSCFNPRGVVWLTALFGIGIDAFSDIGHIYARWDSWDRVVHTIGGFCTGLIVYFTLKEFEKRGLLQLRKAMIIPAVFVTTCTFGFIYEYWEYLTDALYFGHQNGLGDGPDTVDDMMLNVLGSMIFLAVYFGFKYVKQLGKRR